MSLKASNISKRFAAVEVLNSISLTFEPGTVTAIVGDNGAGKSTFLKILAGVHEASSGEVHLDDIKLPDFSPEMHRKAGIEMVFQDFALAKSHDAVSNLFMAREKCGSFGWIKKNSMRKEAEAIFDKLQIRIPDLSANVAILSGGQQQAVAIARAILFNPKVLLLDEPTAALAAREVGRVIELINQQKSEGRIIVLVSHRLNDVFAVSDRVVVLKQGTLFSDDPIAGVTLAEVVQRIVS